MAYGWKSGGRKPGTPNKTTKALQELTARAIRGTLNIKCQRKQCE
jgi:hypothetical protein